MSNIAEEKAGFIKGGSVIYGEEVDSNHNSFHHTHSSETLRVKVQLFDVLKYRRIQLIRVYQYTYHWEIISLAEN